MKILAIESSCDETAAAVVEDGRRVLSSAVASQIEEHKKYGGVVPEIASRQHAQAVNRITADALEQAGVTLGDIDAVAVTYAPGLIGALLVGVNFAKGLSYAAGLPLVPVHHLRSHIAANYITHPDLKPPFLCLVASGGHSHLVEVIDYTTFRIVGRTRDDAAGESLDKAARVLGLPYPGGFHLDRLAVGGNPDAFPMPHPKVDGAVYDFSFSGLKTSVINLVHKFEQKGEEYNKKDVAASFQNAVVGLLTEKITLAAKNLGYSKIALAGGVSANSLLRSRTEKICRENNWELFLPELSLCGDNAAMVGAQGFYEYKSGKRASLDLNAYATMQIDTPIF